MSAESGEGNGVCLPEKQSRNQSLLNVERQKEVMNAKSLV
jgi:hypothetical protein